MDFRNCVLIMTSNACAELLADKHSLGFAANAEAESLDKKQKVLQGIKDIFRPEFLNRIDETVVFDSLGKKDLAQIVDRMLEDLQKRLQEPGLRLRMTAAAKDKLLTVGMDIRYGARPLRRALQKEVEDKLADLYLEGTFSRGEEILVDVINGEFAFTRIKEEPTGTLVPVEEERSHG